MFFLWFLLKFKALILLLVNGFRRAFCCFRTRKQNQHEPVELTHVVSDEDKAPTWSEWTSDSFNEPKTVQDYINQYREQKAKAKAARLDEDRNEEPINFFQDMTPQIREQRKVLVSNKDGQSDSRGIRNDRLNALEETVNVVTSGELGEWDENSGWDSEQLLDHEAQKVLREQKRLERERRALEQHQKRSEKSRTLGLRLAT